MSSSQRTHIIACNIWLKRVFWMMGNIFLRLESSLREESGPVSPQWLQATLLMLIERWAGTGDWGRWSWITLLWGICAESSSGFIITTYMDPGDFLSQESEHHVMFGFLFPSHKTQLQFYTQRVKGMSAKFGHGTYFASWKSWANSDLWEVPTGLIKT